MMIPKNCVKFPLHICDGQRDMFLLQEQHVFDQKLNLKNNTCNTNSDKNLSNVDLNQSIKSGAPISTFWRANV